MHRISPSGFALAIVILVIVWMILPDEAKVPLFIVLVMGALAASKAPKETIDRFFSYLK